MAPEQITRLRFAVLATGALAFLPRLAGQPAEPPIASNPIVTVEGKILKVQITPGQGMPYVELQAGQDTLRVYLGPVRFLMEQGFNPKAGTEVIVKGYKMNPDVVAISIAIPAEKRTLKLRDEHGWPVWRGGMTGQGRGMGPGRDRQK